MATTIATETAEPAAPPPMSGMPRLPAEIDPAGVQLNVDGMRWKEWEVRLPAAAIFADLNEPKIWARVQGARRTALAKGDRVRIIAWDEAWCAETIVAGATREGVTLSKLTRYDLQPRTEVLAGDDTYEVVWIGSATGYRVRRRADQVFMTPVAQTVQQAERDLRNLYPQPANFR